MCFSPLENCNLVQCHLKGLPTYSKREEKLACHPTTRGKTSRSTDLLKWRENRENKTSPLLPNFNISKGSLWIHCSCNPCWVQGEEKGGDLQVRDDGMYGDLVARYKETSQEETAAALTARYDETSQEETAAAIIDRYDEVSREGTCVALVALLKACAKQKDLHRGNKLHTDIVRMGLLEKNFFIGSILVSMYAKSGALEKAQVVFDELPLGNRDVVSWSALIAGYAQHDFAEKAIHCFEQMQLSGVSPNAYTFAAALKACGGIGDLRKGEEIHAHVVRAHLLENNMVVANALIDMYVKCSALEKARDVFEELPVRDVVSCNVLIAGYAQHGLGANALECFQRMQIRGLSPDAFTFACLLKVCGSAGALEKGREIHSQVVQDHLLDKNVVLANALLDMYAKCGALDTAQEVFNKLSARNLVSWNTLITGYVEFGRGEEALHCFEQMRRQGFSPNVVTFACFLKACGSLQSLHQGQYIHTQIVRECMLEKDSSVGTALIDMYIKCGALEKAQEVFDELPAQDVVSWNVLMEGYLQYGHDEVALDCVAWMQVDYPSSGTCACILKACGCVGAAYKGQDLHAHIVRCGFLEQGMSIIPVIAMYANCGMLEEAHTLFNSSPVRNVRSWSALMDGYARLGEDEIVFNLFEKMIAEGVEPDAVAFTGVLNTCSHRGLMDKGHMYFKFMNKGYNIIPTLEHYNCMVDLFGRTGLIDDAIAMIEKMSLSADLKLWRTLVGACQRGDCMKLGSWVLEHIVPLDKRMSPAKVGLVVKSWAHN